MNRTALQTLTLALQYLDSLLAESTPGPWEAEGRVIEQHWSVGYAEVTPTEVKCGTYCLGGSVEKMSKADAALIVALHATAPAIRELLKYDVGALRIEPNITPPSFDVADALLSTPHAAQWITEKEAGQ